MPSVVDMTNFLQSVLGMSAQQGVQAAPMANAPAVPQVATPAVTTPSGHVVVLPPQMMTQSAFPKRLMPVGATTTDQPAPQQQLPPARRGNATSGLYADVLMDQIRRGRTAGTQRPGEMGGEMAGDIKSGE